MEPQLWEEWIELRTNTCEHLRSRSHILQPKHNPLLQLLVGPSFGDSWCIDILETDGILAAYQTTWHSTQDLLAFESGLARLRHPRPFVATLTSVKLDRSETEIRQVLADLEAISFPTDWEDKSITLDGTSYEFQFGDQPVLKWRNRALKEWPENLRKTIDSLYGWA